MLKYLNYVLSVIQTANDQVVVNSLSDEINIYKEYWLKYQKDNSFNPLYNSFPVEFDRHCIILPTAEKVTISWDISQLYKLVIPSHIFYLPINKFEQLVKTDIENSFSEINEISKAVHSIRPHNYLPILLMNFKPTKHHIFLDGRHRYVEYKKINPHKTLPAYILDDEQCFTSILYKNELLSYIILHNIEVIYNFLIGKEPLDRILNLARCMR